MDDDTEIDGWCLEEDVCKLKRAASALAVLCDAHFDGDDAPCEALNMVRENLMEIADRFHRRFYGPPDAAEPPTAAA